MNLQEYISSGILESYVMGDLSERERTEVEKNIALYPELKAELDRVEDTQERLLMTQAVKPREHVRQQIFKKLTANSGEAKVVSINNDRLGFWRWAAAASVTIALISSYLAYDYYSKWNRASEELSALTTRNQRIAEDYNQVNQRLDKLSVDVHVMSNPAFQRVVMKGTPSTPEALASVYWNESSNELYLQVQEMKALSQERQYQLWAIVDGKPVDAGVFDVSTGLIKMNNIARGATNFAVTIEPRGGKDSPTMETMQVIGAVEQG